MTLSTLESSPAVRSVCPRCGHPVVSAAPSRWIETGLGILALAIMTLMLLPFGLITWKACTNLISDRGSHSILFQPLEDWTRY